MPFLALAAIYLTTTPASGDAILYRVSCAPTEIINDLITGGQYQERPQFKMTGKDDGSYPMKLYVGPGGTWSLVLYRTDGLACIIAAGFDAIKIPPGDPA